MDELELRFEWSVPAGEWTFWINGKALRELLPSTKVGLVTGFGDPENPFHAAYMKRLLGAPSDIAPEGRTPLLICSECGDIGCGAITARVSVKAQTVLWSDFWWEADYEEFSSESFPSVRFEFDRKAYEAAMSRLLK